MKIFGIGMNYLEHNKELHGTLLNIEEPVVFTKADSSLLTGGKPFFIPAYTQQCDYETELVVRINHLGRSIPERFAHRYYDEVSVGIDFTARDMQKSLREKGLPWDLCKGFDGSAVVGEWLPIDTLGDVQNLHFHLDINGKTVQSGFTGDIIFSANILLENEDYDSLSLQLDNTNTNELNVQFIFNIENTIALNPDGTIIIPEILRKYTGFDKI